MRVQIPLPRKGTETECLGRTESKVWGSNSITPKGDGNVSINTSPTIFSSRSNSITPKGDGNITIFQIHHFSQDCSNSITPKGDGNKPMLWTIAFLRVQIPLPRKGVETHIINDFRRSFLLSQTHYSHRGQKLYPSSLISVVAQFSVSFLLHPLPQF